MKCLCFHEDNTGAGSSKVIAGHAIVALIAFSSAQPVQSQTIDYEDPTPVAVEVGNRQMVDFPTAYSLPRGAYDLSFTVYSNGGLLAGTNIGLSDFLTVGFSYGAESVFAAETPNYNPGVEFEIKWRLTDETSSLPALAIGFSSQGKGDFIDEFDRYTFKAHGFYGVFSKAIPIIGYAWTWHGGANYSAERESNTDSDKSPNLFTGLSTYLRENVNFAIEYDFAFNDNRTGYPFGKGRGYLNASLKWVYFDNLQIEFTARNLLNNRREANSFERGLKIVYLEFF